MLRLVPFALALHHRGPATDAEAGEKGLEPPNDPTDGENGQEQEFDFEEEPEELERDLDAAEHDMLHDLEDTVAEPLPDDRPRREGTYSSSFSLPAEEKKKTPQWYLKLKDVLIPKTTQADLESYVPNYRYTPILSGIIIPFSILLEIPGLTEHWYIRTEDNRTVETQANPAILDIGLAFSMACAVVANVCLVVRFLEKKVKLMTIACIVFLTIHDIINVIAVTVFGVEHRFDDGFTYGQSFWMTVCSTVVSLFTNFTLVIDLMRTPDFDNSGSGLTRRQRSLAILVILLLSYIAIGSLIHSILLDLTFIDAMYFSLVVIETIGFGDIRPLTTGARLFTCLYAVFGILTIALAVGLTRETILEGLEVGYRKRVQEVLRRRRIGRWRRRVTNRWQEAIEWRLREAEQPVWVRNNPMEPASDGFFGAIEEFFHSLWPSGGSQGSGFLHSHHPHGMHLNLDGLSWKQLEAAAMEAGIALDNLLPQGYRERREENDSRSSSDRPVHHPTPSGPVVLPTDTTLPLTHARFGRMIAMIGAFALAVDESGHLRGDKQTHPNNIRPAKKSLTLQYETFRAGMQKEETRAFYARLVVVWVFFLGFWIVGGLIFMKTERWSLGASLYFCFIAFTTIGYGDYTPLTPAGRSVFVAWALLGVATMTILISVIAEGFSSKYHSVMHTGVFDRAVKRYRERAKVIAEKGRKGRTHPGSGQTPPPLNHHRSREDQLRDAHDRTQTQLEALPHKILADAKTFHEHLSYFVGSGNSAGMDSGEDLPPGLQQLLNEITGAERIGERIKREILQDEDARQTLFTLSIEQALRKMINSAESALQALEERERLLRHATGSAPRIPEEDIIPFTDEPLPVSPIATFNNSDSPLLATRRTNRPLWDTTTSSEDWL
ncbi:Tandem pore domain k+ channel [Mycena indigotica]|uniref:Tandem pore domain k+ channel n=1 Tax=Mycena indigotica TaxID=2126181 RepID=A0A8H6S2E9_9AGAR|nr:Tandem pore domain k+ channel [Mycena indigotica]KAF7291980.1 Tandem pore domain k+ channel [Mycena indigotica]